MATNLQFFNPATLLPNADVAVNDAPVGTNNGFLTGLSESIAIIREEAKRKRDVDQVGREANALAEYTQDKSPDLANYLRQRAATYNPLDTDPNTERQFLTKGFLELSRIEQQDRKIAANEGQTELDNNWKYKLQGSEKRLEAMLRDRQRWDAEENDRVAAENRTRATMAAQGIKTPVPTKRPYPREAEIKALESKVSQLTEAGPSKIAAMATTKKGRPNVFSQQVEEPDLPSEAVESPDASILQPFPEDGANPQPPVYDLESPPKGAAVPEVVDDAPLLNPGDTVPEMTGPVGSKSIVTPGAENDEYNIMAEQANEANEAASQAALSEVDAMMDRIATNKEYFENQKGIDQILAKKDAIKAQIEALPKKGSALWKASVNRILSTLEKDVAAIPKRTAVQEQSQREEEEKENLEFYIKGDVAKAPIKVIKKQVKGETKYFAANVETGQERQDVTRLVKNGDYIPLATDSKTDVIKPGATMKDVVNQLKNKQP